MVGRVHRDNPFLVRSTGGDSGDAEASITRSRLSLRPCLGNSDAMVVSFWVYLADPWDRGVVWRPLTILRTIEQKDQEGRKRETGGGRGP